MLTHPDGTLRIIKANLLCPSLPEEIQCVKVQIQQLIPLDSVAWFKFSYF